MTEMKHDPTEDRYTWMPDHVSWDEPASKVKLSFSAIDLSDLIKVGIEGYIHGYICVRPPCGKEGGRVSHPEHGVGRITGRDTAGNVHAHFADGTRGVLGDPQSFGEPELALAGGGIAVASSKDVVDALRNSQLYTDSQLDQMHQEMAKLERELHEAHQKKLEGFKSELEEKENADSRKRLAWHLGFILGGIALAAVAVVAGIPLLIAAFLAGMPAIGQELMDLRKKL